MVWEPIVDRTDTHTKRQTQRETCEFYNIRLNMNRELIILMFNTVTLATANKIDWKWPLTRFQENKSYLIRFKYWSQYDIGYALVLVRMMCNASYSMSTKTFLFFDVNRCESDTPLTFDANADYFDAVPKKKCPRKSHILLLDKCVPPLQFPKN